MKLRKIIMIAMISMMSLSLLVGCSTESTSSEATTEGEATSQTTEEGASEDGTDTHVHVNPSDYFDENGYYKDVKASDYVTIDGYDAITVTEDIIAVDESLVQAEIDSLLSGYTESEINEDPSYVVKDGDTLNIDYVGSVDGVEFEGGSTQGMGTEVTIGVTSYIDGFLDQLVGHNIGETFDINVTFPADYHSTDLAGKDAVFNITINSGVNYILPEFNDEFVTDITQGQYTSADDFKALIEDSFSTSQVNQYVMEQLKEIAVYSEIPTALTDYLTSLRADEFEHTAMQYGMTGKDLAAVYGFASVEELIASQAADIQLEAENILAVQYVAEMLNLQVSEEDIDGYFDGTDWSEYEEIYGINYIKFLVLTDGVYNSFR